MHNHREGAVVVDGSWNSGPWPPLALTSATGGAYIVRFQINNHGTLKLRAKYPGGEIRRNGPRPINPVVSRKPNRARQAWSTTST
jgi:hypothetical protein